jgi:hypothetical protein
VKRENSARGVVTLSCLAISERVVTTNDAGNYDVPALVLGIYDLKTEFRGFRNSERKGVVAQVARVDFSLQLGNVSDTVEVTGGAPVLETENATIGTVIENKRIADLPLNGRNPPQLVSLTPGTTTNGPASSQGQQRMGGARNAFSLNVAGQRTSNNHYELDGVENTDPNFNTYLLLPLVDALWGVQSGERNLRCRIWPRSQLSQHVYPQRIERIPRQRCSNFSATPTSTPRTFSIPPDLSLPSSATSLLERSAARSGFRRSSTARTRCFSSSITKDFASARRKTAIFNMPLAQDPTANFAGSSAVIYDPTTRVVDASGCGSRPGAARCPTLSYSPPPC